MFTTKQDAIAQVITPALGDYADDFDIDQIFDATFEYDGKGFTQIVDQDTFWAEVEKAAIEKGA